MQRILLICFRKARIRSMCNVKIRAVICFSIMIKYPS